MCWTRSTLPQSLKLSKNQALSVYSELVKTVSGKFECLMCQLYIPWTRCLSHFVLVLLLWVLISWSRGCEPVCEVVHSVYVLFDLCFVSCCLFGLDTSCLHNKLWEVRTLWDFVLHLVVTPSSAHTFGFVSWSRSVMTATCLILMEVLWLPCVS